MAKKGRPVTRSGASAAKHRKRARSWYQSLSTEEREAYVARRDKGKQREADARRLNRDKDKRNSYHRRKTAVTQRRVESGELRKPDTCPRCGRAVNVEWHHYSSGKGSSQSGRWLCSRCHAEVARGDPRR